MEEMKGKAVLMIEIIKNDKNDIAGLDIFRPILIELVSYSIC